MEKEFMLEKGELRIPVKVTESDFEVRRVVLGVHGIGGSAMDDIQTSLAEEMEFFSSAVYRFDFPAHGESPLDDRFFTLKNCREVLMAVANHAKESYPEVEDLSGGYAGPARKAPAGGPDPLGADARDIARHQENFQGHPPGYGTDSLQCRPAL